MQRKAERMKSLHEWTVLGVADAAAFPLLEAGGSVTELFGAAEGGPTGAGPKPPLSPRDLVWRAGGSHLLFVGRAAQRTDCAVLTGDIWEGLNLMGSSFVT